MAVRKVKVRHHHFKIPCWFSFVDSPESFEDIKKFLLEDLKENGFKHFREEEIPLDSSTPNPYGDDDFATPTRYEDEDDDIKDESKFWDIPNSNWT